MRPEPLFPLFAPLQSLPGVGPRLAGLLEKLAGPRVIDLVWHLPGAIIDRRFRPTIAEAPSGVVATIAVTVGEHRPGRGRTPYRVSCHDDTATMTLVFFHAREDYLRRLLPPGEQVVVSGRTEDFNGHVQMVHPDHVCPEAEAETLSLVEPVYPLTGGVSQKVLCKAVRGALERLPADLGEWLDGALLARRGWPDFTAALRAAHAPGCESDLQGDSPARTRLAYDELLANQLALGLVRANLKRLKGRPITGNTTLRPRIEAALPFDLTGAQRTAIAEIDADMAAPARMLRLLQGDVGSGKTVVALMAMLTAVESGAQAVLMAPTEILARQHHATIAPLAAAAGITVALLTGREKGKARAKVLEALASGEAALAVGTHALFSNDVAFHDLALAVIDEQHRFGVHQRLELAAKGHGVDVLVMTATPIPRTLMLTAYGDMDVSRLTDKPPGRQPIATRVLPLERIEEVIAAVGRALVGGSKVYWVCPLVEDSDVLDVAAAEQRHADLAERFGPERVGMVHGRMKGADKDRVMEGFADGDVGVLVATTVIEVGVDVPAATVMVIEHAERFGLAQLHQLRGRIGRGGGASTCLLLYQPPLGETARARLSILRETEDGFRIAEEDLRLRGAGDVLGTRQSGLPSFRIADIGAHGDLMAMARDEAALLLSRDGDLSTERGKALRMLLYMFERDEAIRLLRSG